MLEGLSQSAMWAGYYSNHFARALGRDYERISRPLKCAEHDYQPTPWQEIAERVGCLVRMSIFVPLSLLALPCSIFFYAISYFTNAQRLEIIEPETKCAESLRDRQVSVMSLNACLQEGPFAPLTGGVVPPFAPVGNHPSRIAALARCITSPDVFVGQEFHDLSAQDAFVEELKKQGYRYFIIDRAPHPICVNSGLFVASKRALSDISFIPYPFKDRVGLAKGTQQGVLAFSVLGSQGKRVLSILNTHLNYGSGAENQAARNRQLRNHAIPHFRKRHPSLLIGDFNFDTSSPLAKSASGLRGFVNVCEGQVTCTDEGKAHLRGRKGPPDLEKIDAVIANSVRITNVNIRKLQEGGSLLSDHYAVHCTAQL